jgi:hypothetical protein
VKVKDGESQRYRGYRTANQVDRPAQQQPTECRVPQRCAHTGF